jgi:hypothetical protein
MRNTTLRKPFPRNSIPHFLDLRPRSAPSNVLGHAESSRCRAERVHAAPTGAHAVPPAPLAAGSASSAEVEVFSLKGSAIRNLPPLANQPLDSTIDNCTSIDSPRLTRSCCRARAMQTQITGMGGRRG